jgi:hypothetical protein
MRRMLRPLPMGGLTSGSTGLATRGLSNPIGVAGSPVIRGVGRLVARHRDQRFAGRIVSEKPAASSELGAVQSLVAGACRGSRRLRAPRFLRLVSPPNKPMHPTADTALVISLQRGGAAGDWQSSAAGGVTLILRVKRAGYSRQKTVAYSERGVV